MIRKAGSVQLRIIKATFLAGVLVSSIASAKLEDDIRARINPVGEVCVMGEECAAGLSVTSASSSGPKDPQEVYQTYCFACHGSGVNNSPVLGNIDAWEPRIAKGLEVLYENAINGFNDNTMPARGLCMDCSDDDIKATVDMLVQAAQ